MSTYEPVGGRPAVQSPENCVLEEPEIGYSYQPRHQKLGVHVLFGNVQILLHLARIQVVLAICLMDHMRFLFLCPELPGS